MSPKPLGRSPTCWVLLITCLCAQTTRATHPRRESGGDTTSPPWLHRKDVIKDMPLEYQKLILQETLNEQNVQLTDDVPKGLNRQIPDIIEFLVNGAIDGFLGKVPGVSEILGPIIKGGIGWLTNKFGNRTVYIPNMPPVIKCPASIERIADKGAASKVVSWTEPLGYDAEDGTLNNVYRRGKPPGSKFSGEEIIQYDVRDSKGRTDFCSFSITIRIIKCAPIDLMNHRINTCRGPTRYGDECNFSCVKGYTLVGQQKLTCTQDGVYNFQAPTCNIKTCKAPELPHGGHNWTCSNSYNYDSTCTINCAEGFRNVRTFDRAPWEQANIRCKENGNWTRLPICKDVTAPVINNCPGYTQAYAARGTRSAVVQWDDIRATDVNKAEVTVTQTEGQKSGSSFTEGAHKVSYKAVDESGLNDTCTFYVNVQILHCPVPVMDDPKVNVDCQNQFSYGSACTLSCLQGVTLKGSQRITCEKHGETDMYWEYPDGEPKCAEKPCIALPNPPNAKFSCFSLNGGAKMCSMKCNDGFIPANGISRQRETSCSPATGVWTNTDYPGCVKKRDPTTIKKKVLVYWRAPCAPADDITDVANVTSTMTTVLKDSSLFKTCRNCRVVDVRSSCRAKRSSHLVGLRFSIVIDAVPGQVTGVTSSLLDGVAAAQKGYLTTNFNTLPIIGASSRFKWMDEGMIAGCDPSFAPSPGTLACAACGVGYQSNGHGGCELCPVNTFQDDSGDATCTMCPNGTQTLGNGQKDFRDCKSPCPPGTDSTTGLTPCRDCSIGEYNELEGQKQCMKCKQEKLTPAKGSNSSSDCYLPASKVQKFLCRDVGPDYASCSWFPPAVDNGRLLGYQIDYREVSKSDPLTAEITSKTAESFTLSKLKPDTDYVISIYAMNQNGRGVKTPLNIRTKPPVTTTTTTTTPQPTTVDPNDCPAGSTSFNGQKTPVPCIPCGIGFYQSEAGQDHCDVCPAGFTTWYAGARSESKCVDETWTTPSTTTTTTTPTPTSNGTPCPAGFASSTGTAPGCKKCPDDQEPNATKTACQWCNYIPNFGFNCSPQ